MLATASRRISQQNSTDDGFLEDSGSLDRQQQLLVSWNRRVPIPSYYMLANTLECINEEEANDNEDGTTDDTTDFSGSNRHEDSGVGRTDDSTRNEESSEQELPDMDCTASLGSRRGVRRVHASRYQSERLCADDYDDDDRDVSAADDDERQEVIYDDEGPSPVQCQQFYAMLKERCNAGLVLKILPLSSKIDDRERSSADRDSECVSPHHRLSVESRSADEVSPDHRLMASPDAGRFGLAVGESAVACPTPVANRRSVPRMGTRLDAAAAATLVNGSNTPPRPPVVPVPAAPAPASARPDACPLSSFRPSKVDSSLFNNFSLQTPPNRVFRRFVADTDSSPSSTTTIVESRISPRQPEAVPPAVVQGPPGAEASPTSGNDRAEAYRRCGADVMLTNRANLRHTIALQQTLFQQQLTADKNAGRLTLQPCSSSSSSSEKIDHTQMKIDRSAPSPTSPALRPNDLPLPSLKPLKQPLIQGGKMNDTPVHHSPNSMPSNTVDTTTTGDPEVVKMEWVVKRRSDGTRYVTRRPVKTSANGGTSRRHSKQPGPPPTTSRDQRNKVRCREAAEQRWAAAAASVRHEVACSTDDDGSSAVVSELKVGRYWTREQRRQHVEQRRERDALKQQRKSDAAARTASMNASDTAARLKSTSNGLQHRQTLRSDSATFVASSNEILTVNGNRMISTRHTEKRGMSQYQENNRQLLSVTTV